MKGGNTPLHTGMWIEQTNMRLSIICPKCSFRITSDLEYTINSGICPKCGTEIEALKGDHKGNIGVVNMFISTCKELDLPLSSQQILDLINKYFKEKAKLLLPDFELDMPLSQKLTEMETALSYSSKGEENREQSEVSEITKQKKKPKKVPKMKKMFASSTPGIAVTEQEVKDTLDDLSKEQPLVTPPSQEEYSEPGFSFGDATAKRSTNLESIRQRIQQYQEEEEEK